MPKLARWARILRTYIIHEWIDGEWVNLGEQKGLSGQHVMNQFGEAKESIDKNVYYIDGKMNKRWFNIKENKQ